MNTTTTQENLSMNARSIRKVLFASILAVAFFTAGLLLGASGVEKPSSVIHVVTLDWAEGATEEQIQAALAGVETLAKEYDGITRVWLRSIKSQTKDAAFVMEFESEQALADYANSDAQKKWYEVYLPARGQSVTSDITN
ncbi:MAG TPA: Dabb family protein [Thermoanaerobaculia bacterium]|nr:Dabb family protein [Thermoanaerobaculia bacterium]